MAIDVSALSNPSATAKSSSELSEDELRTIWRAKLQNMKSGWQEFEQRKLTLKTLPFKAIVELTQNCNFRCIMCPQSWDEAFKKYHPEYNMPMEMFVKIADQLCPTATMIDLRGFGETTILPHWPEVVQYLDRFPFVVWHLVTNLSLPRDDTWDKMMKLGFILGFSCDGATKDVFESIRRRSNFQTIRHNLGQIRDGINRHNKGWIYFISTISKKNVHELKGIVELAHEFEVQEVQFKMVQPGLHDEGIKDFDRTKIQEYVSASLDAALDLGVRVTFNDWTFTRDADPEKVKRAEADIVRKTPDPLPPSPPWDPSYWDEQGMPYVYKSVLNSVRVSENQRCFKPFSFTYINYKGEMGTCNHMMYPNMKVMGDLSRESLMDVWNGEKYQDFRRQLLFAQPQDDRCQWCFKHRMDD
jgi:radical SAM protein with 4Fe4S-binding SPASM domain